MFHTDVFHYPDLGGNFAPTNHKHYTKRPIRSTTQIWVVRRHQYGISALVPQTSFRGRTNDGFAKCRLFSPASIYNLLFLESCQFSRFKNKAFNRETVKCLLSGVDPGSFLGGGALVSCSTSTPINHIVFFFGRIPVVLDNRRSSQGGWGAHPLHPPPRSASDS